MTRFNRNEARLLCRPARPLLFVGLLAGGAWAETVQLPYVAPDAGNAQWFVQQPGVLQQQGNQPIFSQAATLTVNGQQPQHNNPTAEFDEKNKELTLEFQAIGPFKITRRLRFEEGQPVRIVDVFENTAGREATANVSLMTNTNYGVNDSQAITDPKNKDATLGWAANTGAERAVMSLFGGKGAKTVPTIAAQQNSNSATANLALKVPGKSKRALVHWHGTFDTADAAVQWAATLKESKATADLPADVRRALANVGTGGVGLPEGLELLRGTATDVVELRTGDVLRGDLATDGVALDTPHGRVSLPADQVAGLVFADGRQWVVTTAGEIFSGRLARTDVPIKLAGGQTVAVPVERVARVGYRSATADLPEWKLDQPTAFLAGGERFTVQPLATPIEMLTRYGPVSVAPGRVAAVLLPRGGVAQQIYLTDGSRLSGVLTSQTLAMKPTATTRPADFATAELARVQWMTLPDDVGAGAATLGLLGEDVVVAKLTAPLKLATAFETITLAGTEIRSITRPRRGDAEMLVTTADQSTFRGMPAEATLTLTLAGGPTLTVPLAAVTDYDNPSPFPAPGVVAKVEDAVKRLSGDDWKVREAAEAELIAIGQPAVSVLQAVLARQSPDTRDRLTLILRTLTKETPPTPTRLTPLPAVE